MANSQIVDYIASQIKAGHSESSLRAHLSKHGWSAASIDSAFAKYHATGKTRARTAKPVRRGGKLRTPRWTKKRRKNTLIALVVLVAAGIVLHAVLTRQTTPAVPPAQHLSQLQKQVNDVSTLGGAVGQFVASNDELPSRVSPGAGGAGVVLCGATCDASTWQVSSLNIYRPSDVKLLPYSPGITVPDTTRLYMVSGAKCQAEVPTDQGVTARSMVILYAVNGSTGLQQRCTQL